DRPEDLAALSDAFLEEVGRTLGRPTLEISAAARARLAEYRWPGNVRELHNVLERAAILSEGEILPEHLALPSAPTSSVVRVPAPSSPSQSDKLEAIERATITRVLAEARFNKSAAAKRLGLSRGQLYQRLR